MGLARNLRKTLINSASRILAELSSVFIRRRARLILKKQDNSSTTTSSQKNLTQESQGTTIVTSSAGTTERITMEKTTEEIVSEVTDWAMERFDLSKMPIGDCRALYEEFAEWIEPQGEDIEVVSLDEITPEEFQRYQERT
jgi:hypothetical protein